MSERYSIPCDCGADIVVELFEAGTAKECSQCAARIKVPNSVALKQLSGDRYPLQSPLDKIRLTCARKEFPFDGNCHQCQETAATFQTLCTVRIMAERFVKEDGGIRPTMSGHLSLVVGASEETWVQTTFPLLLCSRCQDEFDRDRSRARWQACGHGFLLCGLFGGFLYCVYHHAELIAAFSFLIWLLLIVLLRLKYRNSKQLAPFLRKWLSKIRWVADVIDTEDEYRLKAAASEPLMPQSPTESAAS